jgi:flagellar biosynthesis protein FlhG
MADTADVRPSMPSKKAASGRCASIAVTSGKGGVGKTTLSVVLAASLAKEQKKVLLMDADLGLANVNILLGINPRFNISHVISGECGIGDIIVEAAPGVYLAPGASGLEKLANLDAGRLERLRMDFMGLESRYDYLLMDTGAGIGATVTGFARHADLVLLVITPDPSSLADAYGMVKVLYDKGRYSIGVVVNTISNEREGHEAFDRLNQLVVNFLKKPVELYAILPSDPAVQRLGRRQAHLGGQAEDNRFYGLVSMLARKIVRGGPAAVADAGFFGRFFGGK